MSETGDIARFGAPNGFTLLEVLVVIAVIALVTGLLFPRIERTIENVEFASARSMVSAAEKSARAEAIRTDSTTVLQASGDGRSLVSNGRIVAELPTSVRVQASASGPRYFADGSVAGGVLVITSNRSRGELQIIDGTGVARWVQ